VPKNPVDMTREELEELHGETMQDFAPDPDEGLSEAIQWELDEYPDVELADYAFSIVDGEGWEILSEVFNTPLNSIEEIVTALQEHPDKQTLKDYLISDLTDEIMKDKELKEDWKDDLKQKYERD
jgi:hypothetical protein